MEVRTKTKHLGTVIKSVFILVLSIVIVTAIVTLNYKVPFLKQQPHNIPIVVTTWGFESATDKAWTILSTQSGSSLDAVEEGCKVCEKEQCDFTVGYGGSPDENGETTLDAMIMDGRTHDVGAVAALRDVKDAISVARHVLEYTDHTLLVGNQATQFAIMMGFKKVSLETDKSKQMHYEWKQKNCQPNFWKNVSPDPKKFCGPYKPSSEFVGSSSAAGNKDRTTFDEYNHDTIGMIAIDSSGQIAGGTSTNGARNKLAGRVGDSPVPGSGSYVDRNVGGAAATGDGDVMMRLLPSLVAVEGMRRGLSPDAAAKHALDRIVEFYQHFEGGVVAVTIHGEHGAACHGFSNFKYTVGSNETNGVQVIDVPCS